MNCNISFALGYIARNYSTLKEGGYLRLFYDNKIYVIAKQKYNTPKKCITAIHIYISDRNTENTTTSIHPRCNGAVVGEYCVEAVTSGYLPIARPAPFRFFVCFVLFVCLFWFGISLVTWPCEAITLLVLDLLLMFLFLFFWNIVDDQWLITHC